MPVRDGPSCPGCGLPNYAGLCPHCRGDRDAYERELVPPFPTTRPDEPEPEPETEGGTIDASNGARVCPVCDDPQDSNGYCSCAAIDFQ